MKRLLKLLLLAAALTLLWPAAVLAADSLESPLRVELQLPEALPAAGETFEAALTVTGNPGFSAFQVSLRYDAARVRCLGIDAAELAEGMLFASNALLPAEARAVGASTETIASDGTLLRLRLCMAEGAPQEAAAPEGAEPWITLEELLLYQTTGAGSEPLGFTAELVQGTARQTLDPPRRTKDSPAARVRRALALVLPAADATAPEAPASPLSPHADIAQESDAGESVPQGSAPQGSAPTALSVTEPQPSAVTRGQFLTALWYLAGQPEAARAPFTDLPPEKEALCRAVAWGSREGYVGGVTESAFAPDAPVTRETAALILFRCAGGVSGTEALFTATYDAVFPDSAEISPWARAAVYWGVFHKLLPNAGPLEPGKAVTAEDAQAMLTVFEQHVFEPHRTQ